MSDVALRLSSERGRHVYLLAEECSGRILHLQPKIARLFWQTRHHLDRRQARQSADQAAKAAGLAIYLKGLREQALNERHRINPLFLQIPLFSVAPWQGALAPLAARLVSRAGALALFLLAAFSLHVAIVTDWAMASRIGEVFSLQAILTFALLAPVLKLVHEFGHVLAATRYQVPVRKAGLFLLAFYPLPYVDCSDADLCACRRQRIIISLAGLAIDLAIGLLAFLLWHVVDDSWTRQVLSDLFLFNTLNTLLFNLNPLMKLDGYFALADLCHRRNFHLESARAVRGLRCALAEFDWRRTAAVSRQPWHLAYGAAALLYKSYVLAIIAWHLLPKFLGLGILVVCWGFAAMFLSSRLPSTRQLPPRSIDRSIMDRLAWPLIMGGAIVLLAMIPCPYRVTLPLHLDLSGSYTLRSAVPGQISYMRQAGPVKAGELLLRLEDDEAQAADALAAREEVFYQALVSAAGGQDPLAADAALRRLEAAREQRMRLARDHALRAWHSKKNGWFRPDHQLRPGARLAPGSTFGVLLADGHKTQLKGQLPEIYVKKFLHAKIGAELRHAGGYIEDHHLSMRLGRPFDDGAISDRNFSLQVEANHAPGKLAGQDLHLKLSFPAEPLWRHAVFLVERLAFAFTQAQELARRQALD